MPTTAEKIKAKKYANSFKNEFKNKVIDILYTSYPTKEDKINKLKEAFLYYDYEYSEETAKDIVFNEYVGNGGYKDRAYITKGLI